jgi:hypothetical protein
MFDPTIYDNLKVVLEGLVYDLDLQGKIEITNRSDLVDLARMSRTFSVRFQLKIPEGSTNSDGSQRTEGRELTAEQAEAYSRRVEAEIEISADTEDLAGEIMGIEPEADRGPGSVILLRWFTQSNDAAVCETVHHILQDVWGADNKFTHWITYDYDRPNRLEIMSELDFQRKINERQIDDLPELVSLVHRSLQLLQEQLGSERTGP